MASGKIENRMAPSRRGRGKSSTNRGSTGSADVSLPGRPPLGRRFINSSTSAWALIVLVGVVLYANSVTNPFLYEDRNAVVDNPQIRLVWPLSVSLSPPRNSPVAGRPIANLSLALNYAAGELSPTGYHVVNVAIHIVCALLLFGLVRRTLRARPLRERFGGAADGIALAITLVWMSHPIQTEAVAYVTQRTESLMALWYLLTLYCAARAIESRHRWRWNSGAILACALGMATKEVMVTAPVMVVLYDWTFSSEFRDTVKRRWPLYVGLAATWIIVGVLLSSAPRSNSVGLQVGMRPFTYALNQAVVICDYLRLLVWPRWLIMDYGEPAPLTIGRAAPQVFIVLSLLAIAIAALVRWRPLGFLALWMFIVLAPSSSVVPIATVVAAERRMYLASVGPVALVVVVIWQEIEKLRRYAAGAADVRIRSWERHVTSMSVVLVVMATLTSGVATIQRNRDYASSIRMWRTVIARRPHWRARNVLATELKAAGQTGEAIEQLRMAIAERQDHPELYYNLAIYLEDDHKLDEAITYYGEFLRLVPDDPVVRNLLGIALTNAGRFDESMAQFRETLQRNPNYAEAHANLGNGLLTQEKFKEAIPHYRAFLRTRPDTPSIRNKLGIALSSVGELDEAIREFREVVRSHPDFVQAHYNLGLALAATGHRQEALAQIREASRLDPSYAAKLPADPPAQAGAPNR